MTSLLAAAHAHAAGMIYLADNAPAQHGEQIFMFNRTATA